MSKYELVTLGNSGYRANGTSDRCDPIPCGDFDDLDSAKSGAEEVAKMWAADADDEIIIGIVEGRDDETRRFPDLIASYSIDPQAAAGEWY